MSDRNAQYRAAKAKERQAKRVAGLVPVEIWVPAAFKPILKSEIDRLIAEWDKRKGE